MDTQYKVNVDTLYSIECLCLEILQNIYKTHWKSSRISL